MEYSISNIKEAINILECIAKFDNTESQDIKARYFDVIQNDIKKLLADEIIKQAFDTCRALTVEHPTPDFEQGGVLFGRWEKGLGIKSGDVVVYNGIEHIIP